jgi:hypothetical protein
MITPVPVFQALDRLREEASDGRAGGQVFQDYLTVWKQLNESEPTPQLTRAEAYVLAQMMPKAFRWDEAAATYIKLMKIAGRA